MMKKLKQKPKTRLISALLSLTLILPSAVTGTNAVTETFDGQATRHVDVTIDGKSYGGTSVLIDATTYVGIREFSEAMGAESVTWDDKIKTAEVKSGDVTVKSRSRDDFITANNEKIPAKTGVRIIDSKMYVPIRSIAKAFGKDVIWDSKTFSANVTKKAPEPQKTYNETDLYWLSRIINAEAGIEPMNGKIAVGNVVLNRVKNADYPNTVYDVIFDTRFGVQFSPIINGTIYNEPNADSVEAAKRCLDGENVIGSALFFMNPALAETSWISDNRPYVATIGNHSFYS